MTDPLRVGVLGAGMIAWARWGVLPGVAELGTRVEIAAVASRTRTRAETLARDWKIPKVADSIEDLLADRSLDAVINLTPMSEHFATSRAILASGKHLVTEKPLSGSLAEADELIELADRVGRLIVSSPPRMREPGPKRAKALVESGAIGQVAFARVRSSNAGPAWRSWPTDPRPLYQSDAGPLLDMGVYGLHEITGILGPARRVTAVSGRTATDRRVAGGPFDGMVFPVDVDDNVILTLDFGGSAFATIDCTYNVRSSRSPRVEIFGLHGTVAVHDNRADSPLVERYRVDPDGVAGQWMSEDDGGLEAEQRHVSALGRAILLEDLADALDEGRRPILSAEHARHVLEIMLAATESASTGRAIDLATRF